MFALPKQMNIIMLQSKLLTFYFELNWQVRRGKIFPWLRYVGYLRVVARSWFQPLLWERIELAVSREVVVVRPMILPISVCLQTCPCVPFIALFNKRAPSGLCMYPFYCGQVMDRCACSGSSSESLLWHVYGTFVERRES